MTLMTFPNSSSPSWHRPASGMFVRFLSIVVAAHLAWSVTTGWAQNEPVSADPPQGPSAEVTVLDSAWYDSATGNLKPVPVVSQSDDSVNRDSRWLPKAKRVRKASSTNGGGGAGGTNWGGAGSLTFGNVVVWIVLLALVIVVVAVLVYGLSQAEIQASGGVSRSVASVTRSDEKTIERMQHLPAELRLTNLNPREQAEQLFQAGQYDQAIIVLFGHQLLMLDRVGHLRLNRGKTNRRYLRECKAADRAVAQLLGETIEAFERSYFGRHSLTSDDGQRLWQSNLKMEQLIDAAQQVAA